MTQAGPPSVRLPGHLGDERDRLTPQARRRDLSARRHRDHAGRHDRLRRRLLREQLVGLASHPSQRARSERRSPSITVGGSTYIVINPTGTYTYVVQAGGGAIQVISLATNTIVAAMSVTNCYHAAYHPGRQDDVCEPVHLADRRAGHPRDEQIGSPISVGANCYGITITPNGNTAWVATYGSHTIVPITTATNTAGTPVTLQDCYPYRLAITPDDTTAYVLNYYNSSTGVGSVVPVNLATGALGKAITVGAYLRRHSDLQPAVPAASAVEPGPVLLPTLGNHQEPRSTPAILLVRARVLGLFLISSTLRAMSASWARAARVANSWRARYSRTQSTEQHVERSTRTGTSLRTTETSKRTQPSCEPRWRSWGPPPQIEHFQWTAISASGDGAA